MSIDYYRKGRTYELFIRKAFNYKNGKRYGADESLMVNLFLYKVDGINRNQRTPINRQFFRVKFYIEKALIKLKKKKKYIDSYKHFSPISLKLKEATTANDLMKIVNVSLAKIVELENKLKASA